MKKGMLIYAVMAVVLSAITGFFAMFLGMSELCSDEINQYIVETVSSMTGAAYLTFLLARIKSGQWEKAWDKTTIRRHLAVAVVFFLCRLINRAVTEGLLYVGAGVLAYVLSLAADVVFLVCLYRFLPGSGENERKRDDMKGLEDEDNRETLERYGKKKRAGTCFGRCLLFYVGSSCAGGKCDRTSYALGSGNNRTRRSRKRSRKAGRNI